MKKIVIPNAITSLNLLSGSMSVYFSFQSSDKLYIASLFIILAAVFDFFDGFAARMLKVSSEFGKQMDSLSDLISFGLAPTFIMFHLIKNTTNSEILPFVSLIIVLMSAIRLAIFNITDQKYEFKGLPTPALALLVISIPLIYKWNNNFLHINFINFFNNEYILISIVLIFSFLLVSKITMFSLKFKNLKFSENKIRFVFLSLSVILIVICWFSAIPLIILIYVIISFLSSLKTKKV